MAECAGACVACAKTCVASGGDGADCKECTTRDKCEPCMQCYATRVPNPQDADAMKAARARFEQAATPGAVAAPGNTFAGADKDALAAASQLDTCLSYRGRKPADTSCQSANGEAFSVSSVDVAGLQYNELVGQHKTEVMRAVADGFTACFCTTPRSAGMESSYGSSGGSYGSSGSNGHANPAATCQKCHTADKPMGVNCFTSLADMMNGGQPIEGKGGLPLGTVCAGTEYTQTYTCTQAYDYTFKSLPAADGACTHYKNLCCTAPTPAPTPSDHELARTLKMSGTCAVPIVSVAGCESAARAIGFSATKAELIATPFGPPGCWMAGSQLYFNTETDSSKAAPDGNIPNPGSCSHHYQCICGADANMGSSNHGGGGSYGNGSGGSFGSGGNHHA